MSVAQKTTNPQKTAKPQKSTASRTPLKTAETYWRKALYLSGKFPSVEIVHNAHDVEYCSGCGGSITDKDRKRDAMKMTDPRGSPRIKTWAVFCNYCTDESEAVYANFCACLMLIPVTSNLIVTNWHMKYIAHSDSPSVIYTRTLGPCTVQTRIVKVKEIMKTEPTPIFNFQPCAKFNDKLLRTVIKAFVALGCNCTLNGKPVETKKPRPGPAQEI